MAARAAVVFLGVGLVLAWGTAWASVRWVPFSPALVRSGLGAGDEVYAHAWHRLRPERYPVLPQQLVMAHERLGYRIAVLVADGAPTTPDGGALARHSVTLVHAGWPWAAVEGARWATMHPKRSVGAGWTVVHAEDRGVGPELRLEAPVSLENRFLPLRPRLGALAADAIVWGALVALPWLPFAMRRWSRERGGRCLGCGYPAGTSSECSECGRTLPAEVRRRADQGPAAA